MRDGRKGSFRFHPLADAFPLIEGAEFDALVADVKARGLQRPIILLNGLILDGRNRYRAALAAGVAVKTQTYKGNDAVGFVIGENLARRHMDAGQRAMAAAKLEEFGHGGKRWDRALAGEAIDRLRAAGLLNVSVRSVADAATVRDHGSKKLTDAVARGDVAVSTAAVVAELPKTEQDQLVARGEKEILAAAKAIKDKKNAARRDERNARIIAVADNNQPLPSGRQYPIIYADPPWQYEMGDTDRSVENHYQTMPLADICALPVSQLALKDCVLFLWVPVPHLFCSGIPVLKAWGFTHKSEFVWDKSGGAPGMGHYSRVDHEHLLICTRGAVPEPLPANRPSSIIRAKKTRKHSEKPAEAYERIERMYPQFVRKGPAHPLMIELFARSGRPGWASWGNQAPSQSEAA